MKPTIGRIVHYKLSQQDVDRIADKRKQAGTDKRFNSHQAGQVVPLIVVVVWPNEYGPDYDGVNGQALLDGADSLWVTSVKEGTGVGQWAWPQKV